MSNITLYQGDCLIEMKKIPDHSVDLILCDLPYGTTSCSWDVIIPFEDLWKEYKRVLTDKGVVALFGDGGLFTTKMIISNEKWFKYNWTWCKNIKTGFLSAKYQPLKSVETISIFYKKSGQYYPQMVGNEKHKSHHGNQQGDQGEVYGSINLIDVNELEGYHPTNIIKDIKMNSSGRLHPSQKPVELLEYLIKTYTTEGMTVLDNTMGSGSTGVACINTNRDFIRNRNEYRILQNSKKEIRYGYF